MPIKILSRTTGQPQYTGGGVQTALNGNVGDWVETIIKFRAYAGFESTALSSVSINTNNVWSLSSGNWSDLGFQVGQALTGEYNYAPNPTAGTNTTIDISTLSLTVVSITGGDMEVSGALHPSMGTAYSIPSTTPNVIFNFIKVYNNIDFTAVEFDYNQILNSEVNAPTLNSFLDGSTTAFRGSGLDASDLVTVTPLTPKIIQSGSSVNSIEIVGKGITDAFNDFEITLVHQITGIYDQSTDIVNKVKPIWYSGNDCVTDIYKVKTYATAYDESTAVSSDINDSKIKTIANTGWFNENFNGGQNNYSITDVVFEDASSNVINGLSISGQTTIRFNINGSGFSTGSSEFNFGIALSPINRTDLGNKLDTSFGMRCGNTLGVLTSYGHTATATAISESGFPNDVGAQIDASSVWFFVESSNLVNVEIVLNVNADFTSYLNSLGDGNQLFEFWASAGSSGNLPTTDRVNLLFSNQVFTPEILPIILEDVELSKFYPNEKDYYLDETISEGENYVFTPEDDWHFAFQFRLPVSNVINTATVGVELFDISTGDSLYVLDSYSASLSGSLVLTDGTQEINFTSSRNFNYLSDFKDNEVNMLRKSSLDVGSLRGYEIIVPFRMRWEWWIKNDALLPQFFDKTEPNDNLNNEWFTKLSAGVGIRQFVALDTNDDTGTNVKYYNTYLIDEKNYFDGEEYTYLIETFGDATFSTDNLSLGETKTNKYTADVYAILEDDPTYVEATLEQESYSFESTYSEICLEVEDGSGWLSMWKIRTDQVPEQNNPLQPLAGQTMLSATAIGDSISLRCQIDPSNLPDNAVNFKISAYSNGQKVIGEAEPSEYFERWLGWLEVVNDKVLNPEKREFKDDCCYDLPVFASTTDDAYFKNDIKGLFARSKAIGTDWFLIRCSDNEEFALNDNTYGTYFPQGSYTYIPNLKTYQLQWRKVLDLLGTGKYVIKTTNNAFNRTPTENYSCPYNLKEFSFEDANNTVRIESVQNGYIEEIGINFKGINFLDHLRFEGKFGYNEHTYEQDFLIDTNNNQQLNRSDLSSQYVLNSGLVPHECVTKPLFDFYLRATSLYISDYNNDNHSWDYESLPVILENPEDEKYFSRSRMAKVSIKFKERVLKRRVSTCVGDRPLNFLSDAYVFNDQCPVEGIKKAEFPFIGTDDKCSIFFSAVGVGTFTTLEASTNVGTITFSTDDVTFVAFTLPFTPTANTPYYFKRSTATVNGSFIISE